MEVYRALKIRLPHLLAEERPNVLDLAVRMRLAAEEYAERLLKEGGVQTHGGGVEQTPRSRHPNFYIEGSPGPGARRPGSTAGSR
ncbi:Transposase related protein [Thermoproteus tenax Kra 1]|uniref:Transposase related protein n=1 Tax=Thermoproteus tenax (strain ATCC 35583 / DSM 2078 / JCM 9277 / NBRC 100435 / Kra 1) TaxID=768679 RepID=G4RLF1_THETK|nr:Transposase related protein [Thermoproteus tenax Kra 1]